ncbi:LOW QUALITY PROTEIN: uncharacterized protein ACR2FA_002419 [Aphomia sociella]
METTSKTRTPSRCREWERQRRNKFNEAISKLGEVVKAINKANETCSHETEDVQYPKIEIIQKAIICLTNCARKTQLKAEILALQVKLVDYDNNKPKKIDASTQVILGINKKNQSNKYVKLMMLQKSKRKALKEKPNLTTNVTVKQQTTPQKSPKLLPKSNFNNDKKGPENTIVVLPAAPYIFPQRPLLFPTVPPAFVILDSNLQPLNKPSVPIVNRNNGDITKTTMVNILPISAYSRPLSAINITKSKKNNVKSKNDVVKKSAKNIKTTPNIVKDSSIDNNSKEKEVKTLNPKENNKIVVDTKVCDKNQISEKGSEINKVSEDLPSKNNVQTNDNPELLNSIKKEGSTNSKIKQKESELSKIIEPTKINSETVSTTKTTDITSSTVTFEKTTNRIQNSNETDKFTKVASEIETITEDKDKENKLPNILESTLCDNVVDTGNARLELAEEFLAASPTAAFLMSFPLVSGNRADSPAEEPQNTVQSSIKDNSQRRNDTTSQPVTFYEKISTTDSKIKSTNKSQATPTILNKHIDQQKFIGDNGSSKEAHIPCKTTSTAGNLSVSHENPFLNLSMPSLISTNCTMSDSTFGLDFDCNITKPIPNQSSSYVSNNNIFYKGDPFSTVKSTIYSTSSISSGHEFNTLGLYPCAMEKYTSKNKSDYANVEDNLMKIGSSRLTYDIDLGWSHKGFDFVNCTTSTNTFSKDILTTVSAPYSNSYNPFNPEFQLPLVSSSNKKDTTSSKPNASFTDTITSFYSQPTNIWTDDVPFYTNNNISKSLNTKHQNYLPPENMQTNINLKSSNKHYETKQIAEIGVETSVKSSIMSLPQQVPEKYKKSPSKMHINWMTSEIRPMANHCISNHTDSKENLKSSYGQLDSSQITKKQDHNESNYFPISMHNFPTQTALEELQIWPSARPVGPTEISIEPPPINLPTLVGDLALGPHDKKKNSDLASRAIPQTDIQNCSNFLSVTQLMNRSSDNMPSRYQAPNIDPPKMATKQSTTHFINESNRKAMPSRLDSQIQPCYNFNDSKTMNSYDSMGHFSQSKLKTNKSDKSSKSQKNSYSAEALIRGGTCTQKNPDSSTVKFMMPTQKYNNFNTPQENSIAQVSHFPPILDYTDNSYTGQQFSGTTLYNTTTNTISNSFYSNFMPGSSNLMSGNYTTGPFHGEFMDYNQTPECNYANHKYEELKMRNNPAVFHQQDKVPPSYKSSRRESAAKHKLECSKKDSNKKYQSKRAKLNNDVEEWNDPSHLLWQNKAPSKRHTNLMTDELPFPNYVGNQVPAQYQTDFFNSHLMPSSMQSVGHNVDRSLTSLPVTSRANFNLSSIFPEITMKVQ